MWFMFLHLPPCARAAKWTHWGLNPGPSACKADVIPLHHVPGTAFHIDCLYAKSPGVAASSAREATPRGFEPLRAEPNGFRVHLLNRSDTVSLQQRLLGHSDRNSAALACTTVVPRGLEPRTLRLLAVRSNQLSYETSCVYHLVLGWVFVWLDAGHCLHTSLAPARFLIAQAALRRVSWPALWPNG